MRMRINSHAKEAWPTAKCSISDSKTGMQRTAPAATSPSRAVEDEGEEEEDEFLRESREVGLEFVKLLLGDGAKVRGGGGGGGAVPLGPGDEPSGEQGPKSPGGRRQSGNGASGGHQTSKRRYEELAVRMRGWGDEADSAALEEAIKKIVSPTLSTTSVYRVTPHIFRSLSDAVLHELRDKLSSGWKQITAVYQVMFLLVRELRVQTPPNPRTTIQRDREALFSSFPGQYMRDVGLETWVQEQGGYDAISDPGLNDLNLSSVAITPDTPV